MPENAIVKSSQPPKKERTHTHEKPKGKFGKSEARSVREDDHAEAVGSGGGAREPGVGE